MNLTSSKTRTGNIVVLYGVLLLGFLLFLVWGFLFVYLGGVICLFGFLSFFVFN